MSHYTELQAQRNQLDPGDMWGAVAGFSEQCQMASQIDLPDPDSLRINDIQNIVYCGMGGSAIGGDLLNAYFRDSLNVPMTVNRNYTLPGYVNEHSLVVLSSYSGNTEETLSAYRQAQKSGAQIAGISSGGELSASLGKNGLPLIRIPGGLQPRAALGFSFIPICRFLSVAGLTSIQAETEIPETIEQIERLLHSTSRIQKKMWRFGLH